MHNVLLTGGRAPGTLELARLFQAAGHTVFMAESLRGHLSEPSCAVQANFNVPPPRQQTSAFIKALQSIVRQQAIDLLIPTCEESFYVAMGRDRLGCAVYVESLERLRPIHNKWQFTRMAQGFGLPVPETMHIETEADLKSAFVRWPRLVLKPVYSRFASQTLVLPSASLAFSRMRCKPALPWIAQEFVEGGQICTYSLVHQGHLAAHTAYRSEFTAGQGATIVFRHVDHPATFDWVQRFAAATGFSGQLSFDFIEKPNEEIVALECNPRLTSGAHLFTATPGFVEAFFQPPKECLFPTGDISAMLLAGMLLYGLPTSLRKRQFGKWLSTLISSRDVVFSLSDPLPAMLQLRSILHYFWLGWQRNLSPLEASTFDIEWNGENENPKDFGNL